jgi:NAD(P)H-hydrate repair Nnr-like enzyme with NAD(P)H-hydrate epimerase domain
VIPVVTPEEMAAIDAAAPEPVDVLIERAGWAVYRHALDMLGGMYGRRVVVVAGKGNNGADGRSAARRLAARGVRVTVADPEVRVLPVCDLVIDAAYGTGFRGTYEAPEVPEGALVLAVDMPSGSFVADATVTFAALKPAVVFADPAQVGIVSVADIGLDVSGATAWLVEPADVRVPDRAWDAHKYASAALVVAGSPGMTGAATLCARAAMRAGSGYVRLVVPGTALDDPTEAVSVQLPADGWADGALGACDRMRAGAVGPGLGRADGTLGDARRVAVEAPIPLVIDGDGLAALSPLDAAPAWVAPRLLTPHDGELERLNGKPLDDDRLGEVRRIAAHANATVLS